ncbi:MAG: hypothetical protein ACHQ53_07815 [Polyangiales bacterium]
MKLDRDDSVAAGSGSDQQIIDAIVSEGHALLRELSQRGVSREAVRARAGQIGLTKEFVRRCRLSGSTPAMRVCMKCDALFLSAGKHNRLCRRCARS